MVHNPHGVALILSSEHDRPGGKIDREAMEALVRELGWLPHVLVDPKDTEVHDKIREVSGMDHTRHDGLLVISMSHGYADTLCFKGGDIAVKSDLLAPFKGKKCRSLHGKPKVFLINSCRGGDAASLIQMDGPMAAHAGLNEDLQCIEAQSDAEVMRRAMPEDADFLVAYATMPGFVAWRSPTEGSWMMQEFHDVCRQNHGSLHVADLLTETNRQVSSKSASNESQVMQSVNSLTKAMYL